MTKEQGEQTIVVAREFPFTLYWFLRFLFSFGLFFFWWRANRLIVTDRRVIKRSGVFGKSERSVPLQRVQDVAIGQGFLGRIFGYGDLRIESSGSGATEIAVKRFGRAGKIQRAILDRAY